MSLYELATWASVLVLGPGAVAVFAWFLRDLVRMLRAPVDGGGSGDGGPARGGDAGS